MSNGLVIDLFCGGGGASRGYADAGFDVLGIDIRGKKETKYPYRHFRWDITEMDWRWLCQAELIHASPPCQKYSNAKPLSDESKQKDLIAYTRQICEFSGRPYVIENVMEAPLRHDLVLCGPMFQGLRVIRHRAFEANFPLIQPEMPDCEGLQIYNHGYAPHREAARRGELDPWEAYMTVFGHVAPIAAARDAMGIDWKMKREDLSESIPPAYTRYIGYCYNMHKVRELS